MTLLELISKAAAAATATATESDGETSKDTASKYPIAFSPDLVLPNLKPEPESENPNNRSYLVEPLSGFKISGTNSTVVDSNFAFSKKLKRRLMDKGANSLSSVGFFDMLNHFLEEIRSLAVFAVDDNERPSGEAYSVSLINEVGNFLSGDVIGVLIEACVSLGIWGILETLIVDKLVVRRLQSALLSNLIANNRSDMLCLCIRHFSDDLDWSDLLLVLKYFLSPSKEARVNMASVRKAWEDQALLAVEFAGDKKLGKAKQGLAKEAAILLMAAYDGFSAPELCLHYLLSATKVDDMVFSGAISKLKINEISGLIRYLGKWLKKYERFPQAIPCPEAQSVLALNACNWVPTVETVAEALGAVIDEWFSSLVLHSEFHQELKSIEGVLSSLVIEGGLCGSLTSLIEISKSKAKAS